MVAGDLDAETVGARFGVVVCGGALGCRLAAERRREWRCPCS